MESGKNVFLCCLLLLILALSLGTCFKKNDCSGYVKVLKKRAKGNYVFVIIKRMNEGGNVCSALTLSLDLISPRTLVCLRPRRVENKAICHKLQLVAISFLPHPIQNSFISSMTISIVSIHLGLPTLWRLATHSTGISQE